jgi:hypothetical protein
MYLFFDMSYITDVETYTHISTHPLYEYTHAHHTFMSTFERLGQFDLEIHEID